MKTYIGEVTTLEPQQVLVVTTNRQGRHGRGIARFAHVTLGLPNGIAYGRCNRCYCIITKDLTERVHPSVQQQEIIGQIILFYEHAYWSNRTVKTEFIVPFKAGSKPLSGYTIDEFAAMFACVAKIPSNVIFEEGFAELVKKHLPHE